MLVRACRPEVLPQEGDAEPSRGRTVGRCLVRKEPRSISYKSVHRSNDAAAAALTARLSPYSRGGATDQGRVGHPGGCNAGCIPHSRSHRRVPDSKVEPEQGVPATPHRPRARRQQRGHLGSQPSPGEEVQTTTVSEIHSVTEQAVSPVANLTDLISDRLANILLSLLHQVLLHSNRPKSRPKTEILVFPVVGEKDGEEEETTGASKEKARRQGDAVTAADTPRDSADEARVGDPFGDGGAEGPGAVAAADALAEGARDPRSHLAQVGVGVDVAGFKPRAGARARLGVTVETILDAAGHDVGGTRGVRDSSAA
eukprot:755093-Hanusia_phi.AAC.4